MTTETTEARNQAIEALGIKLTLVCVNPGKADIPRKQRGEPSVWQYTLTRNGKAISGPYTMECGLRSKNGRFPTKPTLADILYSLQSDASVASESFDDFCGNCGYDTDSRKALETYLACQKSGTDLRSLGLNLETLGELFQDY